MTKLFQLFTFALVASIFFGCDPCIGYNGTCADPFSFRLVDKTTQADLVFSATPTYQKDSVYLTIKPPGYPSVVSRIDIDKFTSTLLMPVDTFFLRISSTDTDTLLLNYNFSKSNCCSTSGGFGSLEGIKYNGVVANKNGEVYVFKK